MALLPKNESQGELRRLLIEEAEERLRRYPLPPIEEVLEEIRPIRLPEGAPDSTTLLREVRGYVDESSQHETPSGFRQAASDAPTVWEDEDSVDMTEAMDPTELRRLLVEEAEEYRRRHPVPPLAEVVDEIIRDCTFRPADFGAPDSTTLIREERER